MAQASSLMSSSFSSRLWRQATSSLWTLGSHNGGAGRAAIRAAKAKLFFPPASSPDLNPTEQAFAKINTGLAQGRRPNNRRDLANHRRLARLHHAKTMRKPPHKTQDMLQPKNIAR
jgi:transposase